MEVNKKKLNAKTAALATLAGSALLLVGAGCASSNDDGGAAPAATNAAPAPMTKGNYKDGTYTAVGHYTSPAGPESINVSVTLKGNVITDANVDPQATNNKSVYMQGAFISGYKAMVIGKNIDEVNLGNVSGSSLTPMGFNDAIAQVKTKAAK
jgi:uncharacterized protein with FMN-binding domain